MAPLSRLLFVVAALPFVFAKGSASSSDDCAENEFFYSDRSCCVPHGGMPQPPPPPPTGHQCPPSDNWYWHPTESCCVPKAPPPQNPPPPQCNDGWFWHMPTSCCQPSTTPSSTPTPPAQPSGKTTKHRRTMKSRRTTLCPSDLVACPLSGLVSSSDFECISPESDIESCGGCLSTGEGKDCTAMEGVWNVGCEAGVCAVYTCQDGFTRSLDGQSCQKL
ncbi:protein priA [Amylocystis lapponica]|nr:protein priA [Amylocystis lapponica]